jgi:hypothetical protein
MQTQILPSSGSALRRMRRPTRLIGLEGGGEVHRLRTARNICTVWISKLCGMVSLSRPRLLKWISAVAAAASFLPHPAWAHVKWFEPYDVSAAPTPLSGVLTGHFLLVCAGFTLLVVGSFLLDRLVATKLPAIAAPGRHDDLEERVLRAGTGAFFMALFATSGTILTPELHTTADWPAWLQFGIAISMLSARTCVLGSLGILTLYGYGVALYGVFHLSDYPMFLGLAAYLGLTSLANGRLRSQRILVLYVSICVSLMWGAVEKWAYPQWTLPLLAERPYLTFGLLPADFMVVAGFVEFAFAFYILTGHGLLRLAILGLGTIFAAAILDFGKIDAIGHMPILIAFIAMFLHGPTRLHLWLHDNSDSIFHKARTSGTAFATAVLLFFGAYYGLQYAEYGHSADDHNKLAALAAPARAH